MRTVDDAIASFLSYYRNTPTAKMKGFSIDSAAVFSTGEMTEVLDAIQKIGPDLPQDEIVLPFPELMLVASVPAHPQLPDSDGWNVTLIKEEGDGIFSVGTYAGANKNGLWIRLNLAKFQDAKGEPKVIEWQYSGARTQEALNKESAGAVFVQVELINHPANYILHEAPTLTSSESKRVGQGKRHPDAKRPRYIVVDHESLIRLREPAGTHASPIPHHRRGHWRRLTEEHVKAKEKGIEKIWIRPTLVGDLEFGDDKRRYRVLMDFQKGQR